MYELADRATKSCCNSHYILHDPHAPAAAIEGSPGLQEHNMYMSLLGELASNIKDRISQSLVKAVRSSTVVMLAPRDLRSL